MGDEALKGEDEMKDKVGGSVSSSSEWQIRVGEKLEKDANLNTGRIIETDIFGVWYSDHSVWSSHTM